MLLQDLCIIGDIGLAVQQTTIEPGLFMVHYLNEIDILSDSPRLLAPMSMQDLCIIGDIAQLSDYGAGQQTTIESLGYE